MNHRQRALAVLNYESYDRMPIVHFGFWEQALARWADEGHISHAPYETRKDGMPGENEVAWKLGFDFNWNTRFSPEVRLYPPFAAEVLQEYPDGSRDMVDTEGVVVREKPGADCFPARVKHLLQDRASWEQHYKPRLRFCPERIANCRVFTPNEILPFDQGGLSYLRRDDREFPLGLYCGSLIGQIRNWLGVEGLSYMMADQPELLVEIIDTAAEAAYQCLEAVLRTGARFDFGHYWEDICFKNGPLVSPRFLAEKVGPHYRRISLLLERHGVRITSLDCDGKIDSLVPLWLDNGVNAMFPIEVGTWHGNLAPWREKFGRRLLGVGGVNKNVLAQDPTAIDAEIERLKPLVDLGGYIPCPDHRITPEASWDNVRYYCDRMRATFGG
ncbi:MAG: hypothetical protein JW719_07025 [Pirellulales bacterium]|nr:hypothetical protein [Pirellulales bacterium]